MLIILLVAVAVTVLLFVIIMLRKADDFIGDCRRGFDEEYDARRDACRKDRAENTLLRIFGKKFFTRQI